MIMARWAIQHRTVTLVELGARDRRRPCQTICERDRTASPVWPRLLLRDASNQPLAKRLPLALTGVAHRDGETEDSPFPRCREDELAVLPRRRDRTLEVGVDSGGVRHWR